MRRKEDRSRVDTHKDSHYAVALDHVGQLLAELMLSATVAGYSELQSWAEQLADAGELVFGIEGAGSWGAGLCQHLQRAGHSVLEVERPADATGELESPTASTHSQPRSESSEARASQPRAVAGS